MKRSPPSRSRSKFSQPIDYLVFELCADGWLSWERYRRIPYELFSGRTDRFFEGTFVRHSNVWRRLRPKTDLALLFTEHDRKVIELTTLNQLLEVNKAGIITKPLDFFMNTDDDFGLYF
jgi:hypothetical protein